METNNEEKNHKIHVLNGEITKRKAKLIKIEDYAKVVQAIVPMIELAERYSSRVDMDNGHDKEALRIVLADILTLKDQISEFYSDYSDVTQNMVNEVEKLK